MGFPIILTGQRFGRLIVISRDEAKYIDRSVRWVCKCDCGNSCIIRTACLRRGHTTSCGCFQKEVRGKANYIHGLSRNTTPEYRAWKAMKKRCYNPNYIHFDEYGGRGIIVCERWINSFDNFLSDMGERPSPTHSLDRWPDKNGNYEPTNCRWGTKSEQSNNRRNNIIINHNGVSLNLTGWAKRLGVFPSNLSRTLMIKPFEVVYDYYTKK